MANPMKREDILKNTALQMAIDYHRMSESGAAVAAVQRGNLGAVVDSAKVFYAFLAGKLT